MMPRPHEPTSFSGWSQATWRTHAAEHQDKTGPAAGSLQNRITGLSNVM